jgi:small subunit ribosomal protein S4
MIRRPYPPGQHGKRFGGRLSEFGQQLRSKQKVRQTYRMLEKQFATWIKDAIKSKHETGDYFVKRLEKRLDNVVYRMGLAQSRDQARQLVNHGHITVNGKKVSIPSYEIKVSDVIGVREGSKRSPYFASSVVQSIQKYQAPKWIEVKKEILSGTVVALPTLEESGLDIKDVQAIIEYYSR